MTPHTRPRQSRIGTEESERAWQIWSGIDSASRSRQGRRVCAGDGNHCIYRRQRPPLKRASFQPPKNIVGPALAVSNPPQLL